MGILTHTWQEWVKYRMQHANIATGYVRREGAEREEERDPRSGGNQSRGYNPEVM